MLYYLDITTCQKFYRSLAGSNINTSLCAWGWSGNALDTIWGKDSSKVVIDEVAGMMLSVLLIPVTIKYILTGLVLFRFFDIVKPFFIRKMEVLPKGWGVMADDLLAGIYSNIILQLVVFYQVF
jgi:phosphatidylglycerophosphatase A